MLERGRFMASPGNTSAIQHTAAKAHIQCPCPLLPQLPCSAKQNGCDRACTATALLGPAIYSTAKTNRTTSWGAVSHLAYTAISHLEVSSTIQSLGVQPLKTTCKPTDLWGDKTPESFLTNFWDKCRSHCMYCHGQCYSINQTHTTAISLSR